MALTIVWLPVRGEVSDRCSRKTTCIELTTDMLNDSDVLDRVSSNSTHDLETEGMKMLAMGFAPPGFIWGSMLLLPEPLLLSRPIMLAFTAA